MADSHRLTQLEAVVARGLASFVEAGCALLEIRHSELYKLTHPTWRAYCRERWDWSDEYARKIMCAAEVAQNLQQRPITSPTIVGGHDPAYPASPHQVLPLAGLPPAKQREVWVEATRNKDAPTAEEIAEIVAQSGVPVPPEKPKPAPPATPRQHLREEVETCEEESRERAWHEEQLRLVAGGEKKVRQALQWFEKVDDAAEVQRLLGRAAASSNEAKMWLKGLAETRGWLEKAMEACAEL